MSGERDVDPAIRERISSDPFVAWLGIELDELRPGYAVMSLTVENRHLNFHGTPHGGVVYALADSAFGAAGNASGTDGIALETNMSYLGTVDEGETLRAEAERSHSSSRTEEYSVDVRSTDGDRIASFRGRTYKP